MSTYDIDILIYNAHILTINEQMNEIRRGYILIKDTKIVDLGSMEEFRKKFSNRIDAKEEIDARGDIVLPGFVNSHGHFAMTLFRGIADDLPLMDWLQDYIWPIEGKLSPDDCYVGTQLAVIEMILSGTTTACDMYFNEERVLDAVEEFGFRGVLGYGMLDFGDESKRKEEVTNTKKFIDYAKKKANLSKVIISPHAPNTCSEELLIQAKNIAEDSGLGIQMHLAETKAEVAEFKKKHGKTPTKFLDEIGFLSKKLVAAHCVWLSDVDCQLLQKNQVSVAHNPTSNLKLGSGILNFDLLSKFKVNISLGTDGAASNNNLSMLQELRLASYIQKGVQLDPQLLPSTEAVKMATINGAIALGLESEIGSIEIGKKADIILINTKAANVWPPHNPYSLIAFSANDYNIETSIINGKIVMKNRFIENIEYNEVLFNAKNTITRLMDDTNLNQFKDKLKYLH